jgi:hypothetical protein
MDKPTRRLNADDLPPKGSGDSLRERPCLRCGTPMVKMLVKGLRGLTVLNLTESEYALLGENWRQQSPCDVMICLECGYIEIFATNLSKLKE